MDFLERKPNLPILAASSEVDRRELCAEELDSAFEEVADLIPTGTPLLSDEALSQERIYTRED